MATMLLSLHWQSLRYSIVYIYFKAVKKFKNIMYLRILKGLTWKSDGHFLNLLCRELLVML